MLLGRIYRLLLGSAEGAGTLRSDTSPKPPTASLGYTATSASCIGVPASHLLSVSCIQDLLHHRVCAEGTSLEP